MIGQSNKFRRFGLLAGLLALALIGVNTFAQTENSTQQNGDGKEKKSLGIAQKALLEKIKFSIKVDPPSAKPGEVVKLTIHGKMDKDWYTYPITKVAKEQLALTKIKYAGSESLQPIWPLNESEPQVYRPKGFPPVYRHEEEVTWKQDIFIDPKAEPGTLDLKILLNLQVCKTTCIGPADYPSITVPIEVEPGEAVAVSDELKKRLENKQPKEPKLVPISPQLVPSGKQSKNDDLQNTIPPDDQVIDTTNLWNLLGAAFVGAFVMLLTPCVFPMIPITVNFFLKQSEKEHHNPLLTALIYSGTIIVMLTAVILAFGTLVIGWAANPYFNLALGGILVFFALSLFGMYEIELPSGLARFTSSREGAGGYLGAIFMALTFTITSFTCTGPFIGLLMAPLELIKPPPWQMALAALVYSTTFAAPFFLLALFPTLLKALPKSGGWLNTVKVSMGFVELAAALKFLANADLRWNPGNPMLLNNDTVICAWIALSVACGLYLFGVYRLPHDDTAERIGVMRMMFGAIFIGLALYMSPLLFGKKPDGVVSRGIVAFLPEVFEEATVSSGGGERLELVWHKDYKKAWKIAKESGKLLFIDFTATVCQNCRDNESNVFPLPQIRKELKNFVLVQLYTDSVPDPSLSSQQAAEAAEPNRELLYETFGTAALPVYIVYNPDPDTPIGESRELDKSRVLGRREGALNALNFEQFLQNVQKKQKDIAQKNLANKQPLAWHNDYKKAWELAKQQDKLLFIDFAGIADVNGRHDDAILASEELHNPLSNFILVKLYVDTLSEQGVTAANKNKDLLESFGTAAVPTYIVYRPDRDTPLGENGELDKSLVLGKREGLLDAEAFEQFLANVGKKEKKVGQAVLK